MSLHPHSAHRLPPLTLLLLTHSLSLFSSPTSRSACLGGRAVALTCVGGWMIVDRVGPAVAQTIGTSIWSSP